MATAAQIEANRRNARNSTGPRTEEGKNRSRLNALEHGCRANLLVLPTEDFGEFEQESRAWKQSLQPRNPAEEALVDRLVRLGWQEKRMQRAQTALLTQRICRAEIEAADNEREEAIELGQRLFCDARGPMTLHLDDDISELFDEGESFRISDYGVNEDQPMRLVHQLQTTLAGCEWLLGEWAKLHELLEQGIPWLASDKLKAVRLLGHHPIDAIDSPEVARVYLASFRLLSQEGNPFQEIFNELSAEEVSRYQTFLKLRGYLARIPTDVGAARQALMDIVERATGRLKAKAEVLRELAELDALSAADRLAWDDTEEGERLRRYEVTCKRTWLRMFDLLLKIRAKGAELGIGAIASIDRAVARVTLGEFDHPAPSVADDITAPEITAIEPDPPSEPNLGEDKAPSEPNLGEEKAPTEPNSGVQENRNESAAGHKEVRIDTPHRDRKPGGIGIGGKPTSHPVLDRLAGGQKSSLMDLAPIFGKG